MAVFSPTQPRRAETRRSAGKAAANEEVRRTLRYVESLSDARTPLADFFSPLLRARSIGRRDSLLKDRTKAEVRNRIFEVGIQPLERSHVRVGDIFHC